VQDKEVTVPSTIKPGNRIAVVGEAPGNDEVAQGEGFVGSAGRVLNYILAKGGVPRDSVNLHNVVKRLPLFGPTSDAFKKEFYQKKQPTEELLAWREMLRDELVVSDPAVIVAAGDEAMQTLCGVSGITKRRGSIYPSTLVPGKWVVPIVHPAFIIRKARWVEAYISSRIIMEKVLPIAKNPTFQHRAYTSKVARTLDDVRSCVYEAARPISGPLAVDVETYGEILSCVGLGYAGNQALCIPIHTPTGPVWSVTAEAEIWELLRNLFNNHRELVLHNASFDLGRMLEYGIDPNPAHVFDTMQAWHILHAELPKSLEFVTMLLTDLPYYKDERRNAGKDLERLYRYNCSDCVATLWDWERIAKELAASPAAHAQFQFTQQLLPLVMEMQYRGLDVDATERTHLTQTLARELDTVRAAITNEISPDFNPLSPKQVQHYLYDTLKLKLKTKKGKPTADEDAIIDLMIANPKQHTLPLILKFRKMSKALTYTSYKRHHSGKLLYAPLLNATETYRWAFQTHIDGSGVNPQTVPQHLRSQFVPPPGRVFVSPDCSQAEARYVAHYSNNFKLIKIFDDSTYNVHLETGRITLGKPIEKGTPEYDKAKVTRHAFNYGMGPTKLSREIGDTVAEAKQRILRLHLAEPEVHAWHNTSETRVKETGSLQNPFAHRRVFYEALSCKGLTGKFTGDQAREMYAQLPQSIPPHIVNLAMLKLYDEPRVWWHVHTHDGFLASIPIADQEELVPLIMEAMNVPLQINQRTLVTPVECKVGYNWYSMMPWKGRAIAPVEWRQWVAGQTVDVVKRSYGVVLSRYL
jgi:uracil-DNA glycosylase family 4